MNLSTLPAELLVQILSLVNPPDILSVRATCRSLAQVSFERVIWNEAFAYIQEQHSVVDASYDLQSMTRKDLEVATMRQTRFVKRVLASTDDLTPSITVKLDFGCLSYVDIPDDPEEPGFSDAFLVAGGRFLVTNYKCRLISIWDMNDVFGQSGPIEPLTSLQPIIEGLDEWVVTLDEVFVCRDRKAIRMVMYALNVEDFVNSRLSVYEVIPDSHPITFNLLRATSELAYEDMHTFDGNRLAFIDPSSRAVVWDMDLDSSITWELPPDSQVTAIAMKDDHVLLFKDLTHIIIYHITNSAFEGDGQHTVVAAPPSFLLDGPDALDVINESARFHDYRYFTSQPRCSTEPLTVVASFETSWIDPPSPTRDTTIEVFAIEPVTGDPNQRKPLLRSRASIVSPTKRVSAAWGCFLGDSYAVMWSEEVPEVTTIMLSAVDGFTSRLHDEDVVEGKSVGIAKLKAGVRIDMFDFCPVSTRLVTLADGQVQIMGFD